MKPSSVYTGTQMCSAGYWLGTSVKGTISAGPAAEVGSIGVLIVHTDMSKMYEDAGVKKTILRAGVNKARLNPIEPLTPEVKAQIQQNLDDVHSMFRAQVAKGRPNLASEDLAAVTDGSVFLGKRAKTAGLVDNVSSFEQALKLLDSQNPSSNTPSNSKGATMKTVLTPEQISKISAGVPLTGLGLSAEELKDVQEHVEAAAAEAKLAADKEAEKTAAATLQATADAAAAEAAKKLAGTTDNTVLAGQLLTANAQVDLLKSQIVAKDALLVSKETELVGLKASTQSMTANHTALLAIARTATGKMAVALGGTAAASETMDAAAIVAEHARVTDVFTTKFQIGAASKAVTDTGKDKTPTPDDANMRAFKQAAAAAQSRITAKA